ncbi:cytochrome P450 2C44-like [Dromiciops gliroides]|uniref:cytochrome P450 2C44-like n=1 Tax=Dromiciops gliroides TaxID=33562 RepID=UPI001CC7AD0A|nr:cytochrome P450 2C44-like [Dromiciops gliroides]
MEPWGFTTLTIVVCVSFLVILSLWRKDYKGRKLPPGPAPLPIIGNMLQLDKKDLSKSLCKLSEKYGPVYTVYFGSQPVVIIHGYKALKEALIDQGDIFGERGKIPIFDDIYKGHGITFGHGEKWKQIRRFSLMTLRNFGLGKRSIEERIQEEVQFLLEELRKTNSEPFDPTYIFGCAPCNVISSILFHERFNYDNEKSLSMMRISSENLILLNTPMAQGTTVFPCLSSALCDPKEFPNPHQFDPGHFLNEDGSFKKSDYFMAFSIGKRACLGEGLAKMELFLFLVTILQNFTLKSITDPKEINIKPHSTGLVTVPPKFQLCLLPR